MAATLAKIRVGLSEVMVINTLLVAVWGARVYAAERRTRDMHKNLDAFLKHSAMFGILHTALFLYSPELSKVFLGTAIYHIGTVLHSSITRRVQFLS